MKNPEESTLFLLRLHIRRHGTDAIARRIYERISTYTRKARPWQWGSLITFGASAITAIIGRLDDTHTLPTIGLAGIATSIGLGVGMTLLQRSNANSVKSQPVQDSLGEYVDVPDYRNKSVFMSNVIEDIQSVIKSIPEKDRPMVV
ncbi:MAG: hypothetical protein WA364_06380, partial [Candidatus Nitrosopolaris sp.]